MNTAAMNTAAMNDAAMNDEPMIAAAHLAAGHDGAAEVTVAIRYPNGAERTMSLPYEAVDAAFDAAGITSLDELVGRPWTTLVNDHL